MHRSALFSRPLLLIRWVLIAAICGITVRPTIADEPQRVFRAGAATSNITPPLGELIVGDWTPTPAKHVHDELHARCLVIDDGSTKLAIVLCDNVGIPREVFDQAKQRIHQQTALPMTHMLMASTHTHSASTARGESKVLQEAEFTDYQNFLVQRIADGVQRAINHLEPARIGWGQVDEPSEVFNRRWFVNDLSMLTNPFGGVDQVRMNPPKGSAALDRPAGPVDPQISFISVQSVSGRPIALLANYSLHYVGGVPAGEISADYFGVFAKLIAGKLDAIDQSPPFVGILSNGTSGDVNNINFTKRDGKRYEPYEKIHEVAQKVANRVAEAHRTIEYRDWVELGAAQTDLTLTVRKPTPEMLDHFAKVDGNSADDASGRHSREAIYAKRIRLLQSAPDRIDVPLQTLRIGSLAIAAIPFETFTETGLELKHASPFETTFTIELANGSYGYLPTPGQHRLGGYETWLGTNFVQTDASTKIVATLLDLFQSLQDPTANR